MNRSNSFLRASASAAAMAFYTFAASAALVEPT